MLRFEYKYLLTQFEYRQVRNSVLPFVNQDPYTERAPGGAYLVRTLYFDTHDYRAYREKASGDFGRIKLRLRSYSSDAGAGLPVRVEIKARWGWAMGKHTTFVTMEDYRKFMACRHFSGPPDPVTTEFERLVHTRSLRPKMLVEYRREGYKERGGDVRLTFDHRVQSTRARCLFPENPHFRTHRGQAVVFEVKSQSERPGWLCRIMRDSGVRNVANSKFGQGVEVSCPDVTTPAWGQW